MRKTHLLFIATVLLLTNCNKNIDDLVSKIANEAKEHASISYNITQKTYSPSLPDTTITPFEVWVVRDSNDTLREGYVWVNNNYRPYNMIYDAGNFYLAIPPKKTTVSYANYEENFISQADWIDVFLNPDILAAEISAPSVSTIVSDTVYQGVDCSKLIIISGNGKKGGSKKITYLLDKKNLVPLWAKLESKSKDHEFIEELCFSEYEFDNVDLTALKDKQKKILTENPIQSEGTISELTRLEKMLHIGDKAPLFAGNYYPEGEEFKLENYIGKNVIIVDFWYTHCPPCVKAMPALSELYIKYKDKGLKIFGINSVDNQPHSMDKLDAFLGRRDISYDIILTKSSADLSYKISGYPTMYIIDKDGNIAFIEVGFDEEKFKILTDKIEELCR